MISKERVLITVNQKQSGRVPADFSANKWVLEKLYASTCINDCHNLLEFLHTDIVDICGVVDPVYKGPVPFVRELENCIRENFWEWITKMVQTAMGCEEFLRRFYFCGDLIIF
jgi:hypothetical protein